MAACGVFLVLLVGRIRLKMLCLQVPDTSGFRWTWWSKRRSRRPWRARGLWWPRWWPWQLWRQVSWWQVGMALRRVLHFLAFFLNQNLAVVACAKECDA